MWLFWAAKEAAYKALCRFDPALPFVPRAYEFSDLTGEIDTPRGTLFCEWELTSERVHLVCATDSELIGGSRFRAAASVIDRSSVESNEQETPEQQAVRELARRDIAAMLGIPGRAVGFSPNAGVRMPPALLLFGQAAAAHLLSFSHDGRFVAYAFSYERERC